MKINAVNNYSFTQNKKNHNTPSFGHIYLTPNTIQGKGKYIYDKFHYDQLFELYKVIKSPINVRQMLENYLNYLKKTKYAGDGKIPEKLTFFLDSVLSKMEPGEDEDLTVLYNMMRHEDAYPPYHCDYDVTYQLLTKLPQINETGEITVQPVKLLDRHFVSGNLDRIHKNMEDTGITYIYPVPETLNFINKQVIHYFEKNILPVFYSEIGENIVNEELERRYPHEEMVKTLDIEDSSIAKELASLIPDKDKRPSSRVGDSYPISSLGEAHHGITYK